ncbi:MAG: NUDIX domain-containing protein [Thermoanaerobaculia bacterium]|nr:NUDIX domain-containing protein [Thermoanaerobaculia bacterium]
MSREGQGVVKPRHAATVLLLRDAREGPEVFMVERHQGSRFMGGAYVFPGGRVDPEDRELESFCVGLDDATASARLHVASGGLAFYVAAIRECFEEAGVLLAYGDDGELLDTRADRARAEEARRALNQGEIRFLDLVREECWHLATDHMHYWAHWITPERSPIRFDTRFFLATAPGAQDAVHDDAEVIGSAWVTPTTAIEKAEREEWTIILPTLRNLMTVADFSSVAEAEEAGRQRRDVETLQPLLLRRDEGIEAVLPGDEGYEEAVAQAAEREASS